METFKAICGHGSISQIRTWKLTMAMLEPEPELRLDVETVKAKLAEL